MASYIVAKPSKELAKPPKWSMLLTNGKVPLRDNLPKVGLSPHTPHKEAGTRTEPLVSDPNAKGTWCAATAVPDPPEEPPETRVVSSGFLQGP